MYATLYKHRSFLIDALLFLKIIYMLKNLQKSVKNIVSSIQIIFRSKEHLLRDIYGKCRPILSMHFFIKPGVYLTRVYGKQKIISNFHWISLNIKETWNVTLTTATTAPASTPWCPRRLLSPEALISTPNRSRISCLSSAPGVAQSRTGRLASLDSPALAACSSTTALARPAFPDTPIQSASSSPSTSTHSTMTTAPVSLHATPSRLHACPQAPYVSDFFSLGCCFFFNSFAGLLNTHNSHFRLA